MLKNISNMARKPTALRGAGFAKMFNQNMDILHAPCSCGTGHHPAPCARTGPPNSSRRHKCVGKTPF
jgi:hypothetical protein